MLSILGMLAVVALGCAVSSPDAASPDAFDAGYIDPSIMAAPDTFHVENVGERTLYLQSNSFSLRQGSGVLNHTSSCEYCPCGCQGCTACGRSLEKVTPFPPGAKFDVTWDGNVWEVIPAACEFVHECQRPRAVAPTELTAVVGYSDSFYQNDPAGITERIGPEVEATQVTFSHPSSAVIRLEIK